ncbi:DUF480 domain-containing protein [Aquihabitans sp. McL0605]|uniref:DUF480 domain-containing protein n=1 Tax=Aquihabitans sp. McL0605 TaxID=3415671 RepID=UPI003CEFBDE0
MDEQTDGAGSLPVLDPVEQRVLGSLLEKERTVPASYPMTLNSLRTACNQSSSREPVLDLDDRTITDAIDRLKARGLARMVYAGTGARAVKYRQVLDEHLGLEPDQRALLTVLLLRGAQAPGALKTRTERLHAFDDRSDVEACLVAMAAVTPPLVQELERLPGQQDNRWIHLLGPVDIAVAGAPSAPGGPPTIDRDVVLGDGPVARDAKVVASYDALAPTYADELIDELDAKPFDRWMLERLAELAEGGPVADAGCGPGQVGFYLAAAGADVTGFDLAPGMVAEARRRFPELRFEVADLTALPAPSGAGPGWAAIAAWYSLVHLAGSELRPAVALLAAALRPGGWLGVALHVGDEVRHQTELWGQPIDVSFVFHDPAAVLDAFATAGLVDVEWYRRGPRPDGEADTERLYVLARRPA